MYSGVFQQDEMRMAECSPSALAVWPVTVSLEGGSLLVAMLSSG
jgi:hypothetical protein